ncbi:unnamed protein product [Adineta steineri]|uniref:non-specific serine/threonine protein kinase n=1 Tax=Adineta steineri TaxID=433720 RepID=A0A818Q880_9BILA|nr:unnamed protein product [Adineta steineri]
MAASSTIEHDKLPNPNLEWILLDKIGEGTYGQVYRIKSKESNENTAAAKIIRTENDEVSSELENELNILKKISKQDENLPDFIGIFGDYDSSKSARIWFIMELCHLGPITRLIKQIEKKTQLNKSDKEKLIAYSLRSTLKALKYLHQSGIMHRDVKGSHILVTENYTIKLIDFGVAAVFNTERPKRNSSVGTSLWMAPEVIACAHQLDYVFDERCDIWSLGITSIELADGEAPLANLHPTKVLFEVPRRPPPTVNDVTQWSETFSKFISACLIKDYEHRPSAEQLLTDNIFISFNDEISNSYQDLLKMYHQKISFLNTTDKTIENERSTVINDDNDIMNNNSWITNISKPAHLIDPENNLAEMTYLDQQHLIDSIRRRFNKILIYTYIGDVLLAINPKQFLPIDNLNFQIKYLKIRQDLLPHIFAIATKVYNQMMINRQPQCIILSGESGSGKTHAAQNLISELALLGFGEQRALENRLVTMNLLLESFGNAQTVLNNNSSRFGKLLDIFFSEYGTIVYVQLSEFLLEKTRVVLASGNKKNFHIFYSIYSHFSQKQSNPCHLTDQESFDLFQTIKYYTYLGNNSDEHISLMNLFEILKELNVTDNEQSSILAILTSIIHLGNVSFQAETEINEPGCSIDQQCILHANAVYRLLKIDNEQFIQSLCQSSLMTRGETVTKLNTIAEAQQARDAMAKSLYSRLFDWIIFALNRYFRTELEYQPKSIIDICKRYEKDTFNNRFSIRPKTSEELNKIKRDNDLCSISILDLFGFETFDYNSYEQLCINIANEQLQYFFRQHTFAWELKEYENEGIQQTINSNNFDFPNNRSILDMCLSKPIGLLALLDEESRFPQSTEFTLVNKWCENLNSPHFIANTPSSSLSRKSVRRQKQLLLDQQPLFTIHHYAGKIEYTAKDFLEKNRDYVPMEITDLLLQSEDDLVNLLFRSRLRKTGSVIYNEQDKQDKAASLFRSINQKTTTANRTQGTVSTYFRYSLMELVSTMASAQPTFIRCLVPNRLPCQISHVTYDHTSYFPQNFTFDTSQFDENVVLEQIRYSGLLETIEIRRHGYSHRIIFDDFISVYSCLINFKDQKINNKQLCELILKKFHFNDYAIGKTKIFLKFHHIEQLNIAYKDLITKIIRLQSRIRMYLIRKQNQVTNVNIIKSDYDKSVARVQAMVRGFLVRTALKKSSTATLTIQSYWRMWYEQTQFKRRLLHYRNQQIQLSYFLKQIELFGSHLYQQLTNPEKSNSNSMEKEKNIHKYQSISKTHNLKLQSQNTLKLNGKKRNVVRLCQYYDTIYKEFIDMKNKKILEKKQEEVIDKTNPPRPSTAPPITNIPQAPPFPPPEVLKQTSNKVQIFERMESAPATMISPVVESKQISPPVTVKTPVDELKEMFATKQAKSTNPVFSNLFRPVSPPPNITEIDDNSSSLTFRHINHSNHNVRQNDSQSRHRLSLSSSLNKNKAAGLLTSSASSLVGEVVLTSDDVSKLKNNLRKTGFGDRNQTLRRKLPTETVQVDFRNVLRSSKTHSTPNINK